MKASCAGIVAFLPGDNDQFAETLFKTRPLERGMHISYGPFRHHLIARTSGVAGDARLQGRLEQYSGGSRAVFPRGP